MGLNGDYLTLAEAVGEAPPPPLSFAPGVDFDPYDEDEVATVLLATEIDMHNRENRELRRLRAENAQLRARLGIDED